MKIQGGYQPEGGVEKPSVPTTGSGVVRSELEQENRRLREVLRKIADEDYTDEDNQKFWDDHPSGHSMIWNNIARDAINR